jgi:hypothetical protein
MLCCLVRCGIRLERLFPPCRPQRPRLFALITLELISHPEQRTEDTGTIIAGQVDDPGFKHEATEFNEMPRALAALDPPGNFCSDW